jgi:predicted amidohydrolase YtcJ
VNDLLLYNGRVRPLDGNAPTADALAVRGDRILGIGSEADVRTLLAPGAEAIDLRGACLLPGFHDSHVHLTQHGRELSQIDLGDTLTVEAALERVAAAAAAAPLGSWLLGSGFALQRWQVHDLRADDLDRVAPDHPVLLRSQDHHSAWANRRALDLAGIDADTPDPPQGTMRRDDDGTPSGLLLERALDLVVRLVPDPDAEALAGALRRAGDDLAARGITTVHHMAYEPPSHWRALALAASGPDYPLRVWACVPNEDLEHAAAIGIAGGQGGAGFEIGGAKFFADGALGSRTAWMLEPYLDADGVGIVVDGPELLNERVPLAIAAGFAPVVHAIGDAANRATLDAFEASADAWQALGLRPRIEHAQHLHPDDLRRLGRLGVIASMQPIHLTFDAPSIRGGLSDRLDWAYPLRSLAEAGAHLALGSDTPVASPDVPDNLRAACRRIGVDGEALGAEEALTVEQALLATTAGAAYAIGREGRSGRLRPGFDADLVILDHDPHDDLDDLGVVATLKGGAFTFGESAL